MDFWTWLHRYFFFFFFCREYQDFISWIRRNLRRQVLGTIPYFEGNGRSFWYTRVRHLFFGCVYNNDPDIEGKGGEGEGGWTWSYTRRGTTRWDTRRRMEEWIGQTDICKSRPNISGDSISCGVPWIYTVYTPWGIVCRP